MKKVKCFIAVAVFAVSVAACSGSRNSTSTPNSTPNSGTTTPGTTTSPGTTGNTMDSTQHR